MQSSMLLFASKQRGYPQIRCIDHKALQYGIALIPKEKNSFQRIDFRMVIFTGKSTGTILFLFSHQRN